MFHAQGIQYPFPIFAMLRTDLTCAQDGVLMWWRSTKFPLKKCIQTLPNQIATDGKVQNSQNTHALPVRHLAERGRPHDLFTNPLRKPLPTRLSNIEEAPSQFARIVPEGQSDEFNKVFHNCEERNHLRNFPTVHLNSFLRSQPHRHDGL